jgi:hypothetical protein
MPSSTHSRPNSKLASALISFVEPSVETDTRRLTIPVTAGTATLAGAVRALDAAGISVDDIALRRATLDDVFLRLTGRATGESAATKTATKTEVA